jgi:hypothetical protein
MEKKQGIIISHMFGQSTVDAFRRSYKQVKEVQTLTDETLKSILFNGAIVTEVEFGKLFRVSIGRPNNILAISTRYGPVVMKVTSKSCVEILMNRTLEPYAIRKKKELDLRLLSTYSAFVQFIGHTSGDTVFLNIGEMVEKDQTH